MLFFAPTANAQVLDPSWVYGKAIQKVFTRTTHSKGRSIASFSEDGLTVRVQDGWKLVGNKPDAAIKNRTLLLPGFLGTDYVFQAMLRDPEMEKKGYQLIAGNAPGFAGQKVPENFSFSIEAYAALVEKMAEKEKIDTLVGHSYMATVLGEVAHRGKFHGKILMISPALESDDEPLSTRALDLLTRADPATRDLAWIGMYQFMEESFSGFFNSGDSKHIDEAAAEARKTPMHEAQFMLVQYFNYLRSDSYSIHNLEHSTAEIHYLNGGQDIVQLKPENKKLLEASGVKFHHLKNASHMVMIDEPKKINALLRSF